MIAHAAAEASSGLPAYFASLMLKSIDLQQIGCYVCSAEGFPPQESFCGGKVHLFSEFEMIAYIISGQKIPGVTIPIVITIPGEKAEELQVEAKITPLTDYLYVAEFNFPREKIPTGTNASWGIKCGNGRTYWYAVFIDKDSMHPCMFIDEQFLPKLE